MPNLVVKKMRGLRRRVIDFYWERHFGAETLSVVGPMNSESRCYATVTYQALFQQFHAIDLGPNDTFVDIGSGKGRALLVASRFHPARIIGVELNPVLCDVARKNISRLKSTGVSIDIQNISATEYDGTVGNVFYLYNPFGSETLQKFVARLKQGLDLVPRPIRILYSRGEAEHVLASQSWLHKTREFQVPHFGSDMMTVCLWENR